MDVHNFIEVTQWYMKTTLLITAEILYVGST